MDFLDPAVSTALEGLGMAYKSKAWMVAFSYGLSALVHVLRTYQLLWAQRIPDKYVPFVVIALSILGAVAGGITGGQDWPAILFTGLVVGLSAVGGYEAGGKAIIKPVFERLRTAGGWLVEQGKKFAGWIASLFGRTDSRGGDG